MGQIELWLHFRIIRRYFLKYFQLFDCLGADQIALVMVQSLLREILLLSREELYFFFIN
jgi:hypothetical protein